MSLFYWCSQGQLSVAALPNYSKGSVLRLHLVPGLKPASGLGPVCVGFKCSPCACVVCKLVTLKSPVGANVSVDARLFLFHVLQPCDRPATCAECILPLTQ